MEGARTRRETKYITQNAEYAMKGFGGENWINCKECDTQPDNWNTIENNFRE